MAGLGSGGVVEGWEAVGVVGEGEKEVGVEEGKVGVEGTVVAVA